MAEENKKDNKSDEVKDSKSTSAEKKGKDGKNLLKVQGKIVEVLPSTKFRVEIELNSAKHEVIGYLSGRMRMHYIKLQQGDIVDLEISPYDLTKGRITYRN